MAIVMWHFPIVKAMLSVENVLIIEEKLNICKLMATDSSPYGVLWKQTIDYSREDSQRKWPTMGMKKKTFEDQCAAEAR